MSRSPGGRSAGVSGEGMADVYPGYASVMSSDDRWTYPAEGDTPGDTDREATDAETVDDVRRSRTLKHPQDAVGGQGLSSDAPGVDPSERESEGGQPTFER